MHRRALFCACVGVALAAPTARAGPTNNIDLSKPVSETLGPVARQLGTLHFGQPDSMSPDMNWIHRRAMTLRADGEGVSTVAAVQGQHASMLPGPGSAALAGLAILAAMGGRKRRA